MYTGACVHSQFLHSAHKCSYPGCGDVLVIDGNMKNRRDICAATEAGFATFKGLPGAIKTGCQLSPGYQSKFCSYHSPRVACISADKEMDQVYQEKALSG